MAKKIFNRNRVCEFVRMWCEFVEKEPLRRKEGSVMTLSVGILCVRERGLWEQWSDVVV